VGRTQAAIREYARRHDVFNPDGAERPPR